MNTKFTLSWLAMMLFSLSNFAQFTEVTVSGRMVFSDIVTSVYHGSFGDVNSWKYSKGFSVGTNYMMWKDRVGIQTNLFYNERKALEYFPFRGPTLVMWPTSPQSENFNNSNFDPAFVHQPNFKYLHLELMPTYYLSLNEKWRIQSGIGVSGGILLNRQEVIFSPDDFPRVTEWFRDRLDPKDIEYHRWDVAILGEIGVERRLSEKLAMRLSSSMQYSLINLDDIYRSSLSDQMNWWTIMPSLGLSYRLNEAKSNRK
ncbi:MAG: outer membrane beta-barrel protein [Bacteroidota bacterium]